MDAALPAPNDAAPDAGPADADDNDGAHTGGIARKTGLCQPETSSKVVVNPAFLKS